MGVRGPGRARGRVFPARVGAQACEPASDRAIFKLWIAVDTWTAGSGLLHRPSAADLLGIATLPHLAQRKPAILLPPSGAALRAAPRSWRCPGRTRCTWSGARIARRSARARG